jgi:hypothetical protein
MKGKRKGKVTTASPAASKSYEPTANDLAAVDRLRERRKRKRAPRFEVTYVGDVANVTAANDDSIYEHAQLTDLLATADTAFSAGILGQIANIARTGKQLSTRDLNFALATVRAIDPRDSTEALLAVQMAAVHNATMVAARRLTHTDTIPQQDSASNMLNKLARTFAAQIETLKRYRADGEQKVTVQHQHVNVSANQAVVGINQGGGGAHEKSSQSHAPSVSSQSGPSLLGHEQAQPMPLPGAGIEGPARVPDARCQGGSTEGKSQRRVAARNGDQ